MDYTQDFETAVQTFVLGELPVGTPTDASFYLFTSVENWESRRPELQFQLEDGRWTLRRAYPLGTLLSFTVMRDAPGSEEGDAWGQRRPDRYTVVAGEATHLLNVESWQDQARQPRPSTLTGHTESFTVHSPELGDDFMVTVWTPPQAETTDQRFPVLYLHDGGNVFDCATTFAGVEWGCDEAAQTLAEAGLPCLMVAVTIRGAYRAHDYVPFDILHNKVQSSAAQYQGFLADTLRPLIDARFPTLLDAQHTAQAGSSYGGVASLYGGLSSPEVWGTIGAFSPSLGVNDGALFSWSAGYPAPATRLYLDMGTLEGDSLTEAAQHVHRTRLYAAQMRPRLREVKVEIGEGYHHDEAAWAARFPGFLKWWLDGLQD
jgi:predicted alpha/beta superfamily hydrolase